MITQHGLVKREWDGNHMMYVSVCRLHSVEDGNFRRVEIPASSVIEPGDWKD